MVSAILSFVMGAGLRLVMLVITLLPAIDLDALPIAPPGPVRDALGALNWFIPFGDMALILTVWAGVILAVNVALAVSNLLGKIR